MANKSMPSPGASPSAGRWSYDVFLSFRGEDTRNTFTSHLFHSLSQKGINTFIDSEGLRCGEQIAPALIRVIEASRIAIAVFSENYAASSWCLDELSKIVECSKLQGQTLIPIFFNVEPSDVRKQAGPFGTALQEHEKRFRDSPDKVQKWRHALYQASNFSGEHFSNGNEAQFVEKIALKVSEKVGRTILYVANNPVGIDSKLKMLKSLLEIGLPEVSIIGISGIGGIGKTTLAKAIYNLIVKSFEGCSFLENVREKSQQYGGLANLQGELLSGVLGQTVKVASVSSGINLIMTRLQNKRSLLVLDDVDHCDQIEALAGSCDWFGSGSRIILTTRDEHLLVRATRRYRMRGLDNHHALQLLSQSAFGVPYPPKDFLKVSFDAINYAKGLPLALKILGAFLHGRGIPEWELALKKLQEIPNQEIFEVLKVSFDGLSEDEKAIFLDIACFFKWKRKDYAVEVLNSCDFHTELGIKVLAERSLITTSQTLAMHDLIEEMGREIVRRESNMAGRRSRLWFPRDILRVLEGNTGTDAIEAIFLKGSEIIQLLDGGVCIIPRPEKINLNPKAFKKMKRLRILIVIAGHCSCGPNYLPSELRWLEWHHYPTSSLPSNFSPINLVALLLPHSGITKIWDGYKGFPNLTTMNVSHSSSLREVPDVSGIPNLKELIADGCTSLIKVHESVGFLAKLVHLNFRDCFNLMELPSKLQLPSLQKLVLSGCTRLEKFPDILGRMEHNETINLSWTSVEQLPPSIKNLTGVQYLCLAFCRNLKALPTGIYQLQNLKDLDLSHCERLSGFQERIEDISRLDSLEAPNNCSPNMVHLNLSENSLTALSPSISKFHDLEILYLDKCKQLKEIPELPPNLTYLRGKDCESLEMVQTISVQVARRIKVDFSNCHKLGQTQFANMLLSDWQKTHQIRMRLYPQEYLWDYQFQALLPGRDIPHQFRNQGGPGGNTLGFRIHSRVREKLGGVALSAAFFLERKQTWFYWSVSINDQTVDSPAIYVSHLRSDHIWMGYLPFTKHVKENMKDSWNQLIISLQWISGCREMKVKNCGAYLTCRSGGKKASCSRAIRFLCPKRTVIVHEDDTSIPVTVSDMQLKEGHQVASEDESNAEGLSSITHPLPEKKKKKKKPHRKRYIGNCSRPGLKLLRPFKMRRTRR